MTEIEEEGHISKTLGQFRLALNGLLSPLQLYGQTHYVTMVSEEITKLAWQLHWKLEGIDVPYEIENIHW